MGSELVKLIPRPNLCQQTKSDRPPSNANVLHRAIRGKIPNLSKKMNYFTKSFGGGAKNAKTSIK
jgi:hypothetical protein